MSGQRSLWHIPVRPNLLINVNIANPTRLASLIRGQAGQPNPQLNPTQFVKEIRQELSLNRGIVRFVYRKPYAEWVDNRFFFEVINFLNSPLSLVKING